MAQTIPLDKLHFRLFTTKNGLLNNANKAFYQDKQGYVWIGGFGLQRYDGSRFKTFLTADKTKQISYIAGDNNDNLYLVDSDGGLNFLDKKNYKSVVLIDSVVVKDKKEKLLIIKILADAKGNVWVKHTKGFAILRQGTKKLVNISDTWDLKTPHSAGSDFFISDDNCIWQTTVKDGIIRINLNDETVTSKMNCAATEKIFFYKYPSVEARIYKDRDNNFWLGDDRAIKKINGSSLQVDSFPFPYKVPFDKKYKNVWLQNIYCDSKGTVWLIAGENVGIARYNKIENKLEILYGDANKENGLHATIMLAAIGQSFMEDREGNFWLSGDGVLYCNPYGQQFTTYKTMDVVNAAFKKPEEQFTRASSTPNTLVQVKNKDIYIGYYGLGLMKFNSDFTHPVNIQLPEKVHTLLWNMFTIDGVSIYIFDQHKHLIIYNTETKIFKSISDDVWKPRHVLYSYVESDTVVWLGQTHNGISKFNPKTFAITEYKDFMKQNTPYISATYDIIPEGKDFFWISTHQNGLQLFDKKQGKAVKQIMPTERKDACDVNTIISTTRYNEDTLLLSTEIGFIIYNTKTDKKTLIDAANGLPDNYCNSSMVDVDRNFIWINTLTQGICKLNLRTSKVTLAMEEDGNTLTYGNTSYYTMPNGNLLFTQGNGFTTIKTFKNSENKTALKVLINDIIVNSISINTDSVLQQRQGLVLDDNAKEITINFTSLNFWKSPAIQYYAYLQGFDTGWVALGNKSQLDYKGLSSGNYTLRLKCINQNENTENEITTLKICIKPPFYKSILAIIFYILLGGFLLYLFLTWRHKQALKVQALKTENIQNELEIEQVSTYFTKSISSKSTLDDVLADVVKNLMGKLGFDDCSIYSTNENKTMLIKKASFQKSNSTDVLQKEEINIEANKSIVGEVAYNKQAKIINDTSKEPLCTAKSNVRLSKILVPIISNNHLLGVIDAEHAQKNYYTQRHLNLLNTIATLLANKVTEMEVNAIVENQEIAIKEVKRKLAETELAALRSQMNPHFIFNSLNSINSFIIENNTKLASDYLTKFSRLIRLILENSKNNFISLEKELETLRLYLLMESIRFKNKFSYEINIAEDLDLDKMKLPPTTLQPFVENAIWHGIMHLEEPGNLLINLEHVTKDTLLIQIKDNGVGRAKAMILKSKTQVNKSYGIDITEQRLLQLNAANKIEIIDCLNENKTASGTIVNIYLKF